MTSLSGVNNTSSSASQNESTYKQTMLTTATENPNTYASYPDWHCHISTCRSPSSSLARLSQLALRLSNALSTFHFLASRLNLGSKFTKHGRGLQQGTLCHPAKFQPNRTNGLRMCVTKIPKFTKIGDDLLPTQVYHPAKFHHPVSTHEISVTKDLRTNTVTHKETFTQLHRKKQSVNDISPTCISAHADNNTSFTQQYSTLAFYSSTRM